MWAERRRSGTQTLSSPQSSRMMWVWGGRGGRRGDSEGGGGRGDRGWGRPVEGGALRGGAAPYLRLHVGVPIERRPRAVGMRGQRQAEAGDDGAQFVPEVPLALRTPRGAA